MIISCTPAKNTQSTIPATDTVAALSVPDTLNKSQPLFADSRDSASYAIGIFVINFYKQQGISDINSKMVARAIEDAQHMMPMSLTDAEANSAIMGYINKAQAEKSKANIATGEKFLAANKNRPDVITTASGLQYEILQTGDGPKPGIGDSVTCHYKGSFVDGSVFENSYENGKPVSFTVSGVIKGWTEALQLMPVGSKWKLYIPYQLGYGVNDYFSIPGGSALIFEIELLGIPKKN